MLEAFKKAAAKDPKIAAVMKDIGKERKKERAIDNLDALAHRFEKLGKTWVDISLKEKSFPASSQILKFKGFARKDWQELQVKLGNIHFSLWSRMIESLTKGLGLSEESSASDFYETLADLSGYDGEQKKSFMDSMVRTSHGPAKLSQVYPTVATWFVRQNQQGPK